ncbi:MAG: hypothetical protein C5B51_15935 [Terriglobia bacterium]|nr:MAG: hypothetical protein C5B51_15935 [Terriglobia bacterium]
MAASLAALSCSRQTPAPQLQRIAILRFENLSSDPSLDWAGRAFSEIITRELASTPGVYAIPFERLHGPDQSFGSRPLSAPGISAERTLALAVGANRLGYGEYALRAGRIEARLTIEDPQTGETPQMLTASAAAGNVIDAAGELARQLSGRAVPYLTHSTAALREYITGLESAEPQERAARFEAAIADDGGFAPPYLLLAQALVQRADRPGAAALLDRALAQRAAMPELERARFAREAAALRGDNAVAEQALAELARLAPSDPFVWRAMGQSSMNRHAYPQAVSALQKALAIEPDDVAVLNQLGYAAAYAGDLDNATKTLQRYAALRPAEVNPVDSLGDVNLLFGRLREAEDLYLQAAKKNATFLNGGDFFKAAMARLMTGDVNGADGLARQFFDARAAAKDPLADFHKAEWAWMSGRRKEALDGMLSFARSAEARPVPELASQAYGQLAIWEVALGDRMAAAQMAQKAALLATPGSAALAAIARFLTQPPAPAAEWANRAAQMFPQPQQKPLRDLALAYALLAEKQFQAAAAVLQPMYEATAPTVDDSLPFLLAWTGLETGKPKEAASLLRFNPLPPASGVKPFGVFYFPRLFYLRGRVAALAGNEEQARAQYRLFKQLSGDLPLVWAEEAAAAR